MAKVSSEIAARNLLPAAAADEIGVTLNTLQVSVHRVGGESDVGEVAIGMCG